LDSVVNPHKYRGDCPINSDVISGVVMTLKEFKEYLDKFIAENPELENQEFVVYNESQLSHHDIEAIRDDSYYDCVSIVIYNND
jgi:hypothetical protein